MANTEAQAQARERPNSDTMFHDFRRLAEHAEDVAKNPAVPLENVLIETACHQAFQVKLGDEERMDLLNRLSHLLPTLQQDPSSICHLVSALIEPHSFTFTKVMSIEPKVDFGPGLRSPSAPINLATLDLLGKAVQSSSDVGIVAGMREVVQALVQTWLCHKELAVHQRAAFLLESFLVGPNSSDLMWRRLLGDKGVYACLFETCSLKALGQDADGQLSKMDKTIAQGRLLALLSKIDGPEVRTTQCKEVETKFNVESLLDFAVLSMVDWKDDLLMHMALIQFFADWLGESADRRRKTSPPLVSNDDSSPALDYLIAKRLHARTVGYFTQPAGRDLDAQQLYSQSATYLEAYLSLYAEHALTTGQETLRSIIARVSTVLDNTSANQFISSPPTTEVNVLLQLPPFALLLSELSSSSYLNIRSSSSLGFQALGRLFEGLHSHPSSKAASRALYFLYLKTHPDLWKHAIQMAQNLAFKEAAVMAGRLVQSIINAQWEPMENLVPSSNLDQARFQISSEQDLLQRCNATSLPPTGYLAILTSPALESVLPWLLSPAQRGTNLGLGGKGDVDGAANGVAEVKYDALQALHRRLEQYLREHGSGDTWQGIMAQMRNRLAQGRWGGMTEVGGSVATAQR